MLLCCVKRDIIFLLTESRFDVEHGIEECYKTFDLHFKWLLQYWISPYFCKWFEVSKYVQPWDQLSRRRARLITIGVKVAMGSTVKKASKEFYQPMFQNVSQKHMRDCTLVSLDWWLGIVQIDKTKCVILCITDFCTAPTRNVTVKLLGALHKFVGSDFRGFLNDVKPTLLSGLDAEYEKNKKISFKMRLELTEAVNKILEEASKRIQPTGTVIGIITHISWTAAKFPMKCDVLSITGTNEQVVDIKTRSSAMKWPTAFYESFGPKFDIKKFRVGSLLKNMKEHKNPKVLSEGLLWMVSAVDDCGASLLNFKVLKFFLLRNFQLLISLIIKLQCNIEEKSFFCPFDNVSKKQMRECTLAALDSWLGTVHLDKTMRLELTEAVNKILEEASKRIQPTGTGTNEHVVDIKKRSSAMSGLLHSTNHLVLDLITRASADGKIGVEGRNDPFDWLTYRLLDLVTFG
ncbi:hypothetical protein ARALYDRAFT_917687 [Arabidopsis lyrata subsp. lyrata]|uniref:Uncharacterized protein n=1 Tax=Arabidopsis lyrata subsp. lyrata TaxID=81972 RepID=D7ML08_ARALL|nr:hypothetical protein ARALYDRAFT_917687 [Arabidopsis lyrata subsp. lyrata]